MADLYETIGEIADEMLLRRPPRRPSVGDRLENLIRRRSRDHDLRDRLARQQTPPLLLRREEEGPK